MTRTVYVKNPELWQDAQAQATAEGIGLSALVERALDSYLRAEGNVTKCPTCKRIYFMLQQVTR
jgi:hypothetical protein